MGTCKRLFDYWVYALESYLEYKKVEGAHEKSQSFLMRLEGAIILTKVQGNTLPFELLKQEISLLIDGKYD